MAGAAICLHHTLLFFVGGSFSHLSLMSSVSNVITVFDLVSSVWYGPFFNKNDSPDAVSLLLHHAMCVTNDTDGYRITSFGGQTSSVPVSFSLSSLFTRSLDMHRVQYPSLNSTHSQRSSPNAVQTQHPSLNSTHSKHRSTDSVQTQHRSTGSIQTIILSKSWLQPSLPQPLTALSLDTDEVSQRCDSLLKNVRETVQADDVSEDCLHMNEEELFSLHYTAESPRWKDSPFCSPFYEYGSSSSDHKFNFQLPSIPSLSNDTNAFLHPPSPIVTVPAALPDDSTPSSVKASGSKSPSRIPSRFRDDGGELVLNLPRHVSVPSDELAANRSPSVRRIPRSTLSGESLIPQPTAIPDIATYRHKRTQSTFTSHSRVGSMNVHPRSQLETVSLATAWGHRHAKSCTVKTVSSPRVDDKPRENGLFSPRAEGAETASDYLNSNRSSLVIPTKEKNVQNDDAIFDELIKSIAEERRTIMNAKSDIESLRSRIQEKKLERVALDNAIQLALVKCHEKEYRDVGDCVRRNV